MATAKKAVKSKKTGVAKKKVTKRPAVKKVTAKKTVVKKAIAQKKAAKPVIKKAAVKKKVATKKKATKSVGKKKAIKSMKKAAARPVVKKKAAAKASPVVSMTKQLRVTVAALKQENRDLKNELINTRKRADAVAGLGGKRDVAVGKFLKDWEKKTMSALEKSLRPKKKKKSKK